MDTAIIEFSSIMQPVESCAWFLNHQVQAECKRINSNILILILNMFSEFLSLQVPHGLTLLEHLDLLCIADRENMRVVCPRAGLKSSRGEGTPAATIQEPDLGRVFDVAAYGKNRNSVTDITAHSLT